MLNFYLKKIYLLYVGTPSLISQSDRKPEDIPSAKMEYYSFQSTT